jgi:hypothetical protein
LENQQTIKDKIIDVIISQGFNLDKNNLITSKTNDKSSIRNLHKHYREHILLKENDFIKENFPALEKYFANGSDINYKKFEPRLVLVHSNSFHSKLFKLASLLWSVPVSNGYGRRVRYLVFDNSNDKLVGLFALGDPVFNLNARDNIIGWDYRIKMDNLYHILDLYVAGAIPPYSSLLCGKLICMLALTDKVRNDIWNKYLNSTTNITKKHKTPHLALITTSSALGRSSQYNRISFNNQKVFIKVGETSGWGHFHLSNGVFDLMREYLESINHPIVKSNRFGQGPNWKIRFIRTALEEVGLPADLLNHGIKRELYFAPLASNYSEYLNGIESEPIYYNFDFKSITDYFKERWFENRILNCPSYLEIKKTDYLKEFYNIAK